MRLAVFAALLLLAGCGDRWTCYAGDWYRRDVPGRLVDCSSGTCRMIFPNGPGGSCEPQFP